MLCRNISDQLLNQDCLTYTGTAEQTDLSAFLVRAEEINDLDTCLKDLCLCGLFLKARGFAVDRELFLRLRSFFIVDRLSQNIENSSKCLLTDRHHDRSTGRYGIHAADKTVGGTESDASYRIITEMLGNLIADMLRGVTNGYIIGFAFYVVGFLMTSVLYNRAVSTVLVPLAVITCSSIGCDPRGPIILCALSTMSSLVSPMATAVVPMAMNAGGYSAKTVFKVGIIPGVIRGVVGTLIAMTLYPI